MKPITSPALLSAALVAALAGCAGAEHYRKQVAPIQVPAQYGRGDAALNAPAQTLQTPVTYPAREVAADPWWQGFGDERLNRMVEQALKVNADLASAGFALRQARLEARLAVNDMLPQPSASVDASASRQTDRHDNFDRSYGSSASLSWEVDLWGRLRAAHDVKVWEAKASAEDLQNTALALVGEVCQDYWTLAYYNQSIAAGEQNIAELAKTLELVKVQYAAGDVAKLELREAEQNLESERAAQSVLLQERVETRNAITVLLDGRPWPQADEPQNLDAAQSLQVAEGLPAQLLGRRPDLRAAELRLRESLANIKATARSYYPALTLTGAIDGSGTALASVLKNPVATLGASLSLPFLNLGEMKFNTEIAGAEYLQAASDFRTTLYTALQDVDNALSARTQYQAQVEAGQRSYAAAKEIEHTYEVRYRSGYSALRVWLDARQTLRSSELSLAQARRDQLDNDVTLMLALGGSATADPSG
ncbi:MAG: TolC family protein [Pseudoxanthomonas sp.]